MGQLALGAKAADVVASQLGRAADPSHHLRRIGVVALTDNASAPWGTLVGHACFPKPSLVALLLIHVEVIKGLR